VVTLVFPAAVVVAGLLVVAGTEVVLAVTVVVLAALETELEVTGAVEDAADEAVVVAAAET
jgi:hypothetical protein